MAARKVSTPGAPEKAPEPVSTTEQADAALEHITGQDAESQDQSTNETSSLGAPVEPVEDPRIDQILANQARIEKKLDQLLKSGGIEVKKKQRWSQGKHGLELKDI
ncbi:hypothetical protein FOB20_14000 [Acinetobacter lwoffii]|uniref:hypothetical protein n=1 Tax=Acinetobacter lwoffii TaxID=28090 RepID=UPI001583BDE4|nr:hypothetical protein [Acinetobacter lwoffii]QKT97517.1 hypothetical protein FOB20_14000 [Acinetobacter lwoffii]